jgi:hypothetical protein
MQLLHWTLSSNQSTQGRMETPFRPMEPMTTPTDPHPPSRQKQSPEPWHKASDTGLLPNRVYDPEGKFIADCDSLGTNPPAEDQANAARIVACVNSLAGLDDPASALKAAREALGWAVDFVPPHERETRRAVNAALAQLTPKLGAE